MTETTPRGDALTLFTTPRELLGADAQQLAAAIGPDESVSFEVFVPARAAPPPGVLVYISPRPSGALTEGWQDVMNEANLIWVGANDSGNEIDVARRVQLALLAPLVAAQQRAVDEARTYLTGFSGGGRVSSMMVPYYPHVFRGAIFICGANPIGPLEAHQRALLAAHRFVFLTGSGDFNLLDTQFAFGLSKEGGLEGAELWMIEGLEHALPDAETMARALRQIDAPRADV